MSPRCWTLLGLCDGTVRKWVVQVPAWSLTDIECSVVDLTLQAQQRRSNHMAYLHPD